MESPDVLFATLVGAVVRCDQEEGRIGQVLHHIKGDAPGGEAERIGGPRLIVVEVGIEEERHQHIGVLIRCSLVGRQRELPGEHIIPSCAASHFCIGSVGNAEDSQFHPQVEGTGEFGVLQ